MTKKTVSVLAALLLASPLLALDLDEASVEARLSYFDPTQASETFDANFGGGSGIEIGGGGIWKFANGLYLEGALDYYKQSGDKVYIGGGQTINSGFGTDITIIPITATAGYCFMRKAAWSPMVGGGIGYYNVNVTDGDAKSKLGYHLLAGAEFLRDRNFGLGAELKFSSVPDVLGHSGTSRLFGEDNVGGITLTVRGVWRYRRPGR